MTPVSLPVPFPFAIPQPLLEKVLSYLVTRPYLEVNVLIYELTQCQPISVPLPDAQVKADVLSPA